MAIVTQVDLEGRIGENELIRLTDDDATGHVGSANLNRAIADGESEILNDVGQRYTLPLSLGEETTADAVRVKLLDAVVYRLHLRRAPVPEDVVLAYQAATKWAQSIAAGDRGLIGETEIAAAPMGTGPIVVDADERVFGRTNCEGL